MADQQVTAAFSDISLSPPQLPNFPLPRELRDQIYSYLLDGEYVRIKRTWSRKEYEDNFNNNRSGPRAYHFHTNILGVNRAIHDESEELLYKRNTFIVFSYAYPRLGSDNGGLFWLPIVSNKHAPRMKHHAVRIHVSPGTAGPINPSPSGNASPVSAIFLACDLGSFCLIMTTAGLAFMQPGLAIPLFKDATGEPMFGPSAPRNTPKPTAAQLMCTLRDTKYRQIDAATQRRILAPMAQILAPSQRVTFKGIVCDSQEVEHLKRAMSPSLNCFSAYKWTFFKAMSLATDVAKAATLNDDIRFVMNLYHRIARTIETLTYTHDTDRVERQGVLMASPEAVEACEILLLECFVNVACCAVKLRDGKALREACEGLRASMQRRSEEGREFRNIPKPLEGLCYSVVVWTKLYCGLDNTLPAIKDMVTFWTSSDPEPHLAHDSEILLRCSNQTLEVIRRHLPLDQCSAFQLPLPGTPYHKALMEQDRFQGWLDMDLLRLLDDDMKKKVNDIQKYFRIKTTAFDELGL